MNDPTPIEIYDNDPRLGRYGEDGKIEQRPKQFMNGSAFDQRLTYAVRRLENRYFVAFPGNMKQEGNYVVVPPPPEEDEATPDQAEKADEVAASPSTPAPLTRVRTSRAADSSESDEKGKA